MSATSPAQVAIKLLSITIDALRGNRSREQVRNVLSESFAKEPLASCIAALTGAVDGYRGAAAVLMATSEAVLVHATEAERAAMMAGIADIAHEVGDLATEIATRQEAILAQRMAGDAREHLLPLSGMLYKQALLYADLGDHPAAVSLLEEVVSLDEQTQSPDLAKHRAALTLAMKRTSKAKVSKLHEHITGWKKDKERDPRKLVALLNMVITVTSDTLRSGTEEDRNTLAEDLALLRAAGPLPIIGMEDFLHVLQLWLRDEPGMSSKADQLRKKLPKEFEQKLLRVQA
jgi:hypothetical protein